MNSQPGTEKKRKLTITNNPSINALTMHSTEKEKSLTGLMLAHAARPGLRQFGYFAVLLFAAFAAAVALTTL